MHRLYAFVQCISTHFKKEDKLKTKKVINLDDVQNKKFLRIEEASMYLGLGRCYCRRLMDEIGATVHIGGRVVFNKAVIDNYFDNQK